MNAGILWHILQATQKSTVNRCWSTWIGCYPRFHRSGNCAIHFFRTCEKPFFGFVTINRIFVDGEVLFVYCSGPGKPADERWLDIAWF